MKRTKHWLNVLGLIALTGFAQGACAATCTSISSARWDSNNTWSCGHVPASADTVVIASGFTVSLRGTYSPIAALTIDAGGIIDDRGNNLTVSSNIVVNGQFGVAGGGGSLISTGNSTISGTGTFEDSVLEIWGNATIPASSTLAFTLGGQIDIGPNAPPNATLVIDGTISGAGQQNGNNIIKVHSGSALTLNGQVNAPQSSIKIKGNATVTNNGSAILQSVKGKNASSVWTNAANSSLTLGTAGFQGTLNASANGNTVTYPNGMAPIIPSNSTYFNLSGPTCAQVQSAVLTILGTGPCAGGGGGTGGCIPTTINGVPTPVMGGAGQLQIGNGSTVNGGNGAVAITGSNNTVPVTGATVAATPVLPALTPATFPANNSNTNTSATTIAAGSYNKITTGTAPTTFTGGTYYINKLNANGPITLGAGTYYINQLNLYANLTVTGAVQIFIGNGFDVRANNVSVNTPGNVANLQVNFYRKAQLDTHGKNGFSFTGLMYAPDASTQIQIDGNNNTITGAVISGGQVQLNNTAIIYGTTQQNQVATMNTTCTGGGGGATVGGFNAFETSTAANATTGLLYTKLAGTPFGFDVVALQTGGTAVASGFAGTVKVELVDYSAAPATCAAAPLIQSVGTLTFATANAGRMTVPSTTVAAAWSGCA
uniref:DUF7305 domain-containing protein n=1 Tax=mine drainage metagenome TaxID=410659 RepID=E6QW16_9ZZZZ